jgi:Coenzyme PQQ synthesis protein D (PqqD)
MHVLVERGSDRKMLRARQFKIDPRRVVHETIDGETIMIDLDTGTYYSLSGSGPEIWSLLARGWSDTDVTREMQRLYPLDREAAGASTAQLIQELETESLILEVEPNGRRAGAGSTSAPVERRFERPVLEKYTDMKYFLLLDPIHEVDEGGWPGARVEETSQARVDEAPQAASSTRDLD